MGKIGGLNIPPKQLARLIWKARPATTSLEKRLLAHAIEFPSASDEERRSAFGLTISQYRSVLSDIGRKAARLSL